MVQKHFHEYLVADNVERICTEHGFGNRTVVEKFLMDFEVLHHVVRHLPGCVVKGGIAAALHAVDGRPARMSVDTDLVVPLPRDQIEAGLGVAMPEFREREIDAEMYPPGDHTRVLPLVRCDYTYASGFADRETVKLEILYGLDVRLMSPVPVRGRGIFGMPLDFEFSICGREFLIGDKLTTLPRRTVGLEDHKGREVPKHVFDIAQTLMSAPNLQEQEILGAFERTALQQLDYAGTPDLPLDDVWDDFVRSMREMFEIDQQLKFSRQYIGSFRTFSHDMLGKGYTLNHHIEDTLLSCTAGLLLRNRDGNTPRLAGVLSRVADLRNLDPGSRQEEIHDTVRRIRRNHRQLRDITFNTPVQAYLFETALDNGLPLDL